MSIAVDVFGRLANDPETITTKDGTKIVKFTAVSNHKYKDKEEACFLDVVVFGKRGDAVANYLSKGDPIHFHGRLKQDNWEDKDGNKRSKISAVMSDFDFVGKRSGNSGGDKEEIPF